MLGRSIVGTCLLLLAFSLARGADAPATQPTSQHADKFEKQVVISFDYLVSLPPDYDKDPAKKWPLVLFLHGSGERGSNVELVKKNGPPEICDKYPRSDLAREFIVVSPQCPAGRWWKMDDLNYLLDDLLVKYHADADRVYLTGLSMGGFGTWDLAANFPKRFAAIVPVCGGGNPAMARQLASLPIWVFHGTADNAVPVQRSDEMVEALKKVGADVRYTRYEGVGHNCWTRAYATPELYPWLLSHHRGEQRSTAATRPTSSSTTRPTAVSAPRSEDNK